MSVHGLVGPSVGALVVRRLVCWLGGPSVGPLVGNALARRAETSRQTTYFVYTSLLYVDSKKLLPIFYTDELIKEIYLNQVAVYFKQEMKIFCLILQQTKLPPFCNWYCRMKYVFCDLKINLRL